MRLLLLTLVGLALHGQSLFFTLNGFSQAATPTFSPAAGPISTGDAVTISTTTSGATICYTTDNSTPTADASATCTNGTAGTTVTISVTATLKAIAAKVGFDTSGVASGAYTAVSPASDTFTGGAADLSTHTSDSGNTWAAIGANSVINLDGSGNAAAGATNGPVGYSTYTSNWTPPSADYKVCATYSNDLSIGAVIGRVASSGNFYSAQDNGGGAWILDRWVSGSATQLGGATIGHTKNGHTVCLVMAGSAISLTEDGTTKVGPITDTTYASSGSAGLGLRNSGGSLQKVTSWSAQ